MMRWIAFILIVISGLTPSLQDLQDDIELRINETERSLSRKRRYLIFPEGSSFQLVFCFTEPALGPGGAIFTVGSTVALAWELPHDPFTPFRQPSEVLHRIDTPSKKKGGWTVKNKKSPQILHTETYFNPFIINNPPIVPYSTIKGYSTLTGLGPGFTQVHMRKKGGQKLKKRPVSAYIHPVYHQIYRRTRRDLYSKIERLFTGLSRDGKACLFKAICEVSKAVERKGSFMEEIIKAIFRVRHREDTTEQELDEFDSAANKQHNCTEMYPSCGSSIWTDMFSFS